MSDDLTYSDAQIESVLKFANRATTLARDIASHHLDQEAFEDYRRNGLTQRAADFLMKEENTALHRYAVRTSGELFKMLAQTASSDNAAERFAASDAGRGFYVKDAYEKAFPPGSTHLSDADVDYMRCRAAELLDYAKYHNRDTQGNVDPNKGFAYITGSQSEDFHRRAMQADMLENTCDQAFKPSMVIHTAHALHRAAAFAEPDVLRAV